MLSSSRKFSDHEREALQSWMDEVYEVFKGHVGADDPLVDHRVDGVSGATLTGNGVTNLIRYWLGDHGYGPFLRNIHGDAS